MSCSFGIEACKHYITTRYVRLPDLLLDLEMARSDDTYKKVLSKYTSPILLIIDEWLLLKPKETEQTDISEFLYKRRKRSSIIFCSQYRPSEWYEQLGSAASLLADAILDRFTHDACQINTESLNPSKGIS